MSIKRVGKAELHGRRWRVAEIADDGSRTHQHFASQAEAEAYVVVFRSQSHQAVTSLGAAVTEYLEHLAKYGGGRRRPVKNTKCVRSKLYGILRLQPPEMRKANRGRRMPLVIPLLDRPLVSLTPIAAQKLYDLRVADGVAPDTHQSELIYAKAFGEWCVIKAYLRESPFAKVYSEGTLSAGKPQLRIDEARKFIRAAYCDTHPIAGLAAAAILTLGLRSNELLERTVRDLDDGGSVLWVVRSKTKAGVRRVVVPPVLRSKLVKLAGELPPDARIFGTMTDGTLLKHVHRLSLECGVPDVCTHGLRGTQISLTVEIGAMVAEAGRKAGHAGVAVTRAHYMNPGTEESARAARMEELLLSDGGHDTELAEAEKVAAEAVRRVSELRELGTRTKPPTPTEFQGN